MMKTKRIFSFFLSLIMVSSIFLPYVQANGEETQKFYITINYYYSDEGENETGNSDLSDNVKVYEPYIAELQKGTSFNQVVTSPTKVGYEPVRYVNDNKLSALSIALNIQNIDRNITYNVIYEPSQVDYEVRYFFQNIHDDLYTEDISAHQVSKGFTGGFPDNALVGRSFEGFSNLYYEPEKIAADGSTVFYCYYDRNYHIIKFDLDGGYGVEPIYGRYGMSFLVNTPTKAGYVFAGWDLQNKKDDDGNSTGDGKADLMPRTMPDEDLSFKALWTTKQTTYTKVYWLQNADDDNYSYLGSVDSLTAESGTRVSGKDDLSSVMSNVSRYEYERADQNVLVEGDGSTVVNVYYKRKEYTMKFYYAKSIEMDGRKLYYVAGGSTWAFATCGSTDIATMLGSVGAWGEVANQPTLNTNGLQKGYETGEETYNGQTYYYIQFKDRYGADTEDVWPINIFDSVDTVNTHHFGNKAYFSAWNVEHNTKYSVENYNKTLKGHYLRLDDTLLYDRSYEDRNTIRFLAFWENGSNEVNWNRPNQWIYRVNLPVLEGEESDSTYNGVSYKKYAEFYVYDNNDTGNPHEQTATGMEGFVNVARVAKENKVLDATYGIYSYYIDFYYARNSYKLIFNNYGHEEKNIGAVPYESNLKGFNFVPTYPDTLEKDAYEFKGWYTSPGCYDGTEFNFDKDKMPASDLMLYAKWAPVSHAVNFYHTYNDMLDKNKEKLLKSIDVSHGNVAAYGEQPTRDGYTFMGWFYMKDGVKTAYTPYDMPVNRDLEVFAEWRSELVAKYHIKYRAVKENSDGTYTVIQEDIADPKLGRAFVGTTRTFSAKAGTPFFDLKVVNGVDYNKGWFPLVSSHSILMDLDESKNEFIFDYIYCEKIPYTVRYVEKDTNTVLCEEKYVANNANAVVTERFKAKEGYVPDAFYKRLILSAREEDNVITFYYTKDVAHSNYVIKHYLQNMDGTTYTEYMTVEGIAESNSTVDVELENVPGYVYAKSTVKKGETGNEEAASLSNNKISALVVEGGTEIKIYYNRLTYGYTVKYIDYNTKQEIADTKIGEEALLGTEKTEEAISITGYMLIGNATMTKEIRADKTQNVFIFYYTKRNLTINYKTLCTIDADNYGSVSQTREIWTADANRITGSKATAGKGYKMAGWYTDDEGIITDETVVVDRSKLTAVKADWVKEDYLTPDVDSIDAETTEVTYYAVFEAVYGQLMITKTGAVSEDNQTFLFEIEGAEPHNKHVKLTVAVNGNGSVTIDSLLVGTYKVTEKKDWSWRYEADGGNQKSIDILEETKGTLTFANVKETEKWLDGNDTKKNIFHP